MVKNLSKYIIFAIPFCLLVAFTFTNTASAAKTDDGFIYEVKNNKVIITGYDGYEWDEVISSLKIPNKIDGKKVVNVKRSTFNDVFGAATIKKIICSDYMTNVNVDNLAPLFLSEITLGKYTKTFNQYGQYRGNFTMLKKVNLAKGSKYLKKLRGGIYSKDKKVLYAYPSAAKKAFKVSSKTKKLAPYAFFCSYAKYVKLPKGVKSLDKKAFYGYAVFSKGVVKVPGNEYKRYKKWFAKQKAKYVKVQGY